MADPQGIGEPSRPEPVIAELRSVAERLIFCKRLLRVDRRRQEPPRFRSGELPAAIVAPGRTLQRSEAKPLRNQEQEGGNWLEAKF
jgi:hypothetical protein